MRTSLARTAYAYVYSSVIRIDRPDIDAPNDVLCRNKRSIAVTPKTKAGLAIIKKLITSADVLIDPFRPGALEKLGLGPTECLRDNPRLVYARMAGYTPGSAYGQMAGHDINYIALSGLLAVCAAYHSREAQLTSLV